MLRVAVMVSGGGTNLQAIIDAVKDGTITNTELVAVISNNAGAYALTRAKDNNIPAYCISPKDYESRDAFNDALLDKVNELNVDLIVLAGFLVRIPEKMVHQYSHRIINIHPSLIPSFCGVGFYGLKVHEAALAKGVKVSGATVHYVDEGMDTGEIIFQKAVDVLDGDTPETLQRRIMEQAEWKLLPKAIVGSGGREHAICWKLSKSPKVDKIYCAPGNAGIAELAECVDIKAMEFEKLVAFAKENSIDLTVIGMDDPLVGGVVDVFEAEGLRVFGPRKNAAILEGSKAFSKDLMKKYNIPTAAYETFTSAKEAKKYLETAEYPIVLKADGLALCKRVLLCENK